MATTPGGEQALTKPPAATPDSVLPGDPADIDPRVFLAAALRGIAATINRWDPDTGSRFEVGKAAGRREIHAVLIAYADQLDAAAAIGNIEAAVEALRSAIECGLTPGPGGYGAPGIAEMMDSRRRAAVAAIVSAYHRPVTA